MLRSSPLVRAAKSFVPGWMKRSLREAYISPHAALSYAQEGEDLILGALLGSVLHRRAGFYVDVGAHDPWRFSNTCYFYQRGWHGINIDPRPGMKALFDPERPRDINLEMAIARSPGSLTYHCFDEPLLNGFDRELCESRDFSGKHRIIGKREIPAMPLAIILKEHLPESQRIDFLSVDVEGMDLEALQSNDWEQFHPTFVLAEEIGLKSLSEPGSSEISSFLRQRGYILVARTRLTAIYADESQLCDGPLGIHLREEAKWNNA